MSAIEAMVSLWPVEDGFATVVWRRVDGEGFSPSNRVQAVGLEPAGALGGLILQSLDLSAELSREAQDAAAAESDFAALASLRPRDFTGHFMVDREESGTVLVWQQRFDAAGYEARQAFHVLQAPDASSIENAIKALVRGEGVPPGDAADLDLLVRELELVSRNVFTTADGAAAFAAVAPRFEGHPVRADLERAAALLADAPSDRAELMALLTRLWEWLDAYDLRQPRSLA